MLLNLVPKLSIVWFHLDCIMQLKESYHIATNVCSRKSATTFGDLPDCWEPWQPEDITVITQIKLFRMRRDVVMFCTSYLFRISVYRVAKNYWIQGGDVINVSGLPAGKDNGCVEIYKNRTQISFAHNWLFVAQFIWNFAHCTIDTKRFRNLNRCYRQTIKFCMISV